MAFAANIMTATAAMMAMIITATSCARPTAVMTESSEKIMSMIAIWAIVAANPAKAAAVRSSPAPSRLSWISTVLFQSRNKPPPIRMMSRPEISVPGRANSGVVSRITQVMDSSSRMRVTMAKPSPSTRPLFRWCWGSLPTRMEMKMMLSMPRTISSAVSVTSAIHASGLVSQSIIELPSSDPLEHLPDIVHREPHHRRPAVGAGMRHAAGKEVFEQARHLLHAQPPMDLDGRMAGHDREHLVAERVQPAALPVDLELVDDVGQELFGVRAGHERGHSLDNEG